MPTSQLSTAGASVGLEYHRLASEEIRLLDVKRVNGTQGGLQCVLRTTRLDKPLPDPYHAVSYTWQTAEDWSFDCHDLPSEAIQIGSKPALLHTKLQYIIRTAFKHLFLGSDRTRIGGADQGISLWIDALCIDQNNVAEKSQQVAMMRGVFGMAASVFISLGTPVLDQSRSLLDLPTFSRSPGLKDAILGHPYWRRSWIIQEIVCGRNVVVQMGERVLEFETLIKAGRSLTTLAENRRAVLNRDNINLINTLRMSLAPWTRELGRILENTRYSVSTDAHDAVYSKLGIAEDADDIFGKPDYALGIADMLIKLATSMAESQRSLRFLCFTESPRPDLPSWVPDWTQWNEQIGLTEANLVRRRRASHRYTGPEFRFSDHNRTMHASGLVVGTLLNRDGNTGHRSSSSSLDWEARSSTDALTSMYRTLIVDHPDYSKSLPDLARLLADRATSLGTSSHVEMDDCSESDIPWQTYDHWYRRNCALVVYGQQLQVWVAQYQLEEPRDDDQSLDLDLYNDLASWTQVRMELYHKNRKISILDDGSPALVPDHSRDGDVVCILFDCPLPMVLREAGGIFQVVGHCYVDSLQGIKDWDEMVKIGSHERIFEIR